MNLTNPSELKLLLGKHGFRFSKAMGQNFLIASWVPERIASEAGIDEGTGVLEVGPGVGCLTHELAQYAGRVLAVELDERLRPVLQETLADCENTEVIFGDVLKQNLPALVQEHFPGLRPVVCANLPYNVTSPLLTAFLEAGCFETVTVMVQREVAKRLCAKPGTADYGAFTVFTQWHAEPEILFDVSPGCFLPAPKVTSSVVKLTVRKAPPVEVQSEKRFFAVVRAAFNQRRKTLLNALSSGLSGFTKEQITQAIADCGLDEKVRGEALGIAAFAQLSDRLEAMAKETTA
jgi:16S rRNA (adenine1518-N6/adenine1519-N6)-dimethyltransferase